MTEYVTREDYNEVLEYAPDWAVIKWDLADPKVVTVEPWCFGHNRADELCERMAPEYGCIYGLAVLSDHTHDWVDARNEAVESGEYCSICLKVRKGNWNS